MVYRLIVYSFKSINRFWNTKARQQFLLARYLYVLFNYFEELKFCLTVNAGVFYKFPLTFVNKLIRVSHYAIQKNLVYMFCCDL